MSFFISNAAAEGAAASAGAPMDMGIMLIIMVVIMIVMMYPQMRRAKKHREMIGALGKGEEVVTSGGMLGRVSDISEDFLTIEIAEGTKIKVQKHAIVAVMPKGTIKTA